MRPTQKTPDGDVDLDEDLFDFAGVMPAADANESEEDLDAVFASFRDMSAEEELLAVPKASTSGDRAAPAASTPARTSAPEAQAAAPAPPRAPVDASARASTPASGPEPVRELAPRAPTPRFSKSLVAIALAVTVLNSALAVTLVRRPSATHTTAAPAAPVASPSAAHAAAPEDAPPSLPDPERVGELHAHPVLDEARAQISRGEYASARQKIYGLLAIIDRLEDPRRSALEADCQFLIAQSLHLEALQRMGGSQ